MSEEEVVKLGTIALQAEQPGEEGMVNKERWEQIRRLFWEERRSVSEIARQFELDRKTVRHWTRQGEWKPYERSRRTATLLSEHEQFVRERAAQVNYSARILYQELRQQRGYVGGYDTVKLFVRPLREAAFPDALTMRRFETGPGQQSQIDWGQSGVHFRSQPAQVHFFVLTLGFSRRALYHACANEQMGQFLDAHERAFEHFGGLTHEHLYDRPRTVCRPDELGKRVWNPTFKAFADYWGFEPRVCRAYRAQTKGKVESGVKYLKRNFLPGRAFVDIVDLQAQLDEWNASIADQRVHGTTHEQPLARFERERAHLLPSGSQPGFRLAARRSRIVADDWLVNFEANRYSVPFNLVGRTVEVQRQGEAVLVFHRDQLVANHRLLAGKYQVSLLPEHGPGAVSRNARSRSSTPTSHPARNSVLPEVEVRDPAVYDALMHPCHTQEVAP